MEFRVLQYFLAVAREESVSGAAESGKDGKGFTY